MNNSQRNTAITTLALATTPMLSLANDVLGKDFTIAFPTNYEGSGIPTLFFSAQENTEVKVTIPGLAIEETLQVLAGEVGTLALPQAANRLGSGEIKDLGVFVESSQDISVYGMNEVKFTTDGFTALPNDVLGREYYILSYYPLNRNNWRLDSELVIVATEDNTQVQIIPSVDINSSFLAHELQQITLNKGQTFQLSSYEEDVSGTFIRASLPIGVYGAHECADVPSRDSRIGWCDYLVETMIPVNNWGYHYDLIPLATRLSGDVFRVMASEDNTPVDVNGQVVAILAAGEFYEAVINGPMSVSSSKPIMVAQYAMGQGADNINADPFMMNIVPFEQFLSEYLFTTPADGFVNNFVNVVVEVGTNLLLNGNLVDISNFNEIPGSNYIGGQLSLSIGQHAMVADKPFGAYVYGFNAYDSYGYPAGQAFADISPRADSYAPNISSLRHIGHQMAGYVSDNEDLSANGILDPGEDLNGNGLIDGRSEDANFNNILDPGEDLNGNGVLDKDVGFVTLKLADGSQNVELDIRSVTSSRYPLFAFGVKTMDPRLPGSATLIAEDLFGNQTSIPVEVPSESALVDVKVVSVVNGDRIVVNEASFSKVPDSIVSTPDDVTITWSFDKLLSSELQAFDFDVALLAPREGEQRIVTKSLTLSYLNKPHSARKVKTLGPQSVLVASSAFALNLTANTNNVGPNSDIIITSQIENLSDTLFDAELQLEIIGPNGESLAVTVIDVPQLDGGATTNINWDWNSAGQFAGEYTAKATLLREDQIVNETNYLFQVVRGTDVLYPLDIDAAIGLNAGNGIIIEQVDFSATDIVPVSVQINNVTQNEIFGGGRSVVLLVNSTGQIMESHEKTLSSVAPGESLTINQSFQLDDIAPGVYTVWIYLYDADDNLVGVSSYTINILENSNSVVTGSVSAQHPELLRGDDQTCHETFVNSSVRDQANVEITSNILDVTNQVLTDSGIKLITIPALDEINEAYIGSTAAGLSTGQFACVVKTTNAGIDKTLGLALFDVYNLIAVPGNAQTLEVGDTLTLDATGSRESEGLPLTYQWTLVDKPDNSLIELTDAVDPIQTFLIDQQGTYTFELSVNNGTEESLPKLVSITVTNRLPSVDAGPDQLITLMQNVQLNGLNTTDDDNDLLEFAWSFVSKPEGSSAQMVEPDTGSPSFEVDVEGVYIAELTVTDDAGGVAKDQVILSAGNLAPVADAGATLSGQVGDRVTLDGSSSFDVNGDQLFYDWQMISRPPTSTAKLINGKSARPFFDIDVQGDYVFELIVSDGALNSDVDRTTVTVGNVPPVANAGPDGSLVRYSNNYLDGNESFDADGDALQYQWSIISTPRYWYRPTLYEANTATPYFSPSYDGDYVIQLRVFDGTAWSNADTVTYTTANVAPSVNAYLDTYQTIYSGDRVNISAYTYDSNGDSVSVKWELIEKPEGSLAVIEDPEYRYTSFIADEPGDYVAQVTASDGELQDVDTVYIYGAEACINNLDIRPKSGKVQLTWDYNEDTTWVDIYRSTNFEGPYEWVGDTNNSYSVYIDETVNNGTQYYYRFEREFFSDDYGEYGGPIPHFEDDFYFGDYGDYGDYGEGDYFFYRSCESQVISSIPDRRVRYNLVPDLRGLTVEEAEAAAAIDSFSIGEVIFVRTTAVEAGRVIQQDSPRNSRLPRGSQINLYIATW
ncbi:PKD domain-containing protein [Reinekea marina]|uniref:PKD domain-containing protein n=1 Tax=Reinekea marina TaxID=1310421 RepID=A0ABV7WQV1_9GAMM|nr:PKD domain-containing protein [Reinekea marina]MDN3648047.1 PKD domain-containing protein [Reinekea marina]